MTEYTIDIQNDHAYHIPQDRLRLALTLTLNHHQQPPNTTLSLVFEEDDAVQSLNQTHRHINAPTDVLSFPADMPTQLMPDFMQDAPYLGDLIIAYPYARAQAEKHNHPLDDSLCLLAIHGCLHLLGYDHDTATNKAHMWHVQSHILQQLHINPAIVPPLEE